MLIEQRASAMRRILGQMSKCSHIHFVREHIELPQVGATAQANPENHLRNLNSLSEIFDMGTLSLTCMRYWV